MKRNNWPVAAYGIRPAGSHEHCFYCGEARGQQHKAGCVIRSQTVVVEMRVELVISVPEDWDGDMIEFSLNESSRCADNLISNLTDMQERLRAEGRCTCGDLHANFVREATPDDEAAQRMAVADLPT